MTSKKKNNFNSYESTNYSNIIQLPKINMSLLDKKKNDCNSKDQILKECNNEQNKNTSGEFILFYLLKFVEIQLYFTLI